MEKNTMDLPADNFSKIAQLNDLLTDSKSDVQKQTVIETIVDVLNSSYDKADAAGNSISGYLVENGDKVNLQISCVDELTLGNITLPIVSTVTVENIPSNQLERVDNNAISLIREDDGNIISRFQDNIDFDSKVDELKAFVALDFDYVDTGVDKGMIFDETDINDAANYVEPAGVEFDSDTIESNIETIDLDNDYVGENETIAEIDGNFDSYDIEYAAVASEIENADNLDVNTDNLELEENDNDTVDKDENDADQNNNDWWDDKDFFDSVD